MGDAGNVIIRFDKVSFGYTDQKMLLNEASFSVREKSKITVMGQNGAGKSTLFKLILGSTTNPPSYALTPNEGMVHIRDRSSVAIATQVMPEEHKTKTVREFFETAFLEVPYNLDKLIAEALDVVNYHIPSDRKISDLSGGQQARLLLAYALIQKPDILLLDEPTNNLDAEGIGHLIYFLMMYEKTVLVISHDAEFLNSFTDGVLYLDAYTGIVEQYVGNYSDVVQEIAERVEKEQRKNAQLLKSIQDQKDKVNFFSHKGGKMRKLASKMRENIEEAEENMVDVRKEDRAIDSFVIPAQHLGEEIVTITELSAMKDYTPLVIPFAKNVRKGNKVLLKGPNGIGKSTFLQRLFDGTAPGASINPKAKVGYYRQDFSGLDMSKTGFQALEEMMSVPDKETVYRTAAQFNLPGNVIHTQVGAMSEGQKGLLSYARFVLQEPSLLLLDEPTNHINFRHLPVIAEALNNYEGAIIIICHHEEFVNSLTITDTIDFTRFL
ncbi:MAG: ABC-F family ATP-binding cassette domain-containing protein [Candidatus Magasanikbacteria bacterium]|nr:ABC-F family ATP-binding cassette domain-containing protein [Candidatus Magasanikbacteria bacterium]